MSEIDWFEHWPTSPGWYWFYGWLFESEERNKRLKELISVKVVEAGWGDNKHLLCMGKGTVMYKKETGKGVWRPMDVPPIPEE